MKRLARSFFVVSFIVVFVFTFLSGCSSVPFFQEKIDFEAESDTLYQKYLDSISDRKNELSSGRITIGDNTLELYFEKIGNPGSNGYPLYIALRGGGIYNPEFAEDQYKYMESSYNLTISSGIYVAPKGIVAAPEEHNRPEAFPFYDRIIEDAIAFYNVDPNRVYILGFSSGGHGVYAIAPRMADRFAAADASAGYPWDMRVCNLYNLPICVQMGELDTDFDRASSAAWFDGYLEDAQKEYGGGFVHETFIHRGGTHNKEWNDIFNDPQDVYTGTQVKEWLNDPSKAVSIKHKTGTVYWLKQYTRNPYPEKVVWNTDVSARLRESQAFYWLDRDGGLKHSEIVASYSKEDNSVTIEKCDVNQGTLKVYLNPEMLDVYKCVKVNVSGKNYYIWPKVSRQIMEETLYARGDKNYIFTSEIDISFDKSGSVTKVKSVDIAKTDYSQLEGEPMFYWDEYGLFYINESLFGATPKEISSLIGQDLPKTVSWDYWGYNLTWTYYNDPSGQSVIFLFQNNRCVIIFSEIEGKPSYELLIHNNQTLGHFPNGMTCVFGIYDNEYGGVSHTQQRYTSWDYEEWEGMIDFIQFD